MVMCATYRWSCDDTKTRPWRPTADNTNRIGMGRKAPPSLRLARRAIDSHASHRVNKAADRWQSCHGARPRCKLRRVVAKGRMCSSARTAEPGPATRATRRLTCDIIYYPQKVVWHGTSQETTPPPATASSSRSESTPPSPTTEALGSTR